MVVDPKARRESPRIEPYLGVRSAYAPTFLGEAPRIAFLMNLTGVAEPYVVDRTGGWPDLLVERGERVALVAAAPSGHDLVLAVDQGGNERYALWLYRDDGVLLHPLTHDAEAVHLFGAWSHDGQSIAYTENSRNGRDFDVVVHTVGNGERRTVYQGQGMWRVLGYALLDEALLLLHERSNFDQDLYRLDLTHGTLTHLTPHVGRARYPMAGFGMGQVFCLCDDGRDFLGILSIPEDAAEVPSRSFINGEWLVTPEADVEELAVSSDGQCLAYAVNRDGYSEVHVWDTAIGRNRLVEGFPEGVVGGLVFSPDGLWLACHHHGPKDNLNVYAWAVESGYARLATRAPRPGLSAAPVVRPDLVAIPTFDGRTLPAFVYRSPAAEAGRQPVIVSIHGGPEAQERPVFNPLYQFWLASGYAVVAPNVRGSTGYGKAYAHLDDREKRGDAVRDLEAVAGWISLEPDLDGERIAAVGGSYGGYMVLQALTRLPDKFKVGVDIVGIANLETFLEHTGPWRRHLREEEYGRLDTDRALLRELSPIHAISRLRAPLMVIHGKNDPRVPVGEAESIVAALRERGQVVEYLCFEDEGHGLVKLANRRAAYPQMVEFLARYL